MKRFISILFVFLLGCTPYSPPTIQYADKIEVYLNNQMAGNFYVQMLSGNTWGNVLILRNVQTGKHYDTIPYVPGLYRIITVEDSTQIFNIK